MFSFDMIMDRMPNCSVVSSPAKSGMFDMLVVGSCYGCDSMYPYLANGDSSQRERDGDSCFVELGKEGGSPTRILFVGDQASSLGFLESNPLFHALVILSENSFPFELQPHKDRCFAIWSSTESVASLVMNVQIICNWYQRWQDNLKASLLEKGSYQQLFDRSESVLSNFISLTDSSFRLIAHTRGIAPQDEISLRLIQNGYHDIRAIDFFKKEHLFEKWGKESGLRVYEHSPTSQTESASYIFRMQGTYFMHVVMRFSNRPRSKGLMDAFSIFISHLEILVRREWRGARMRGTPYARTLIGLISGKLTKSTLIEEELSVAGISQGSQFVIMCFSPNEKSQRTSENERAYYLKMLLMEFPEAKVVEYGETVAALFEMKNRGDERSGGEEASFEKGIIDDVSSFLNVHGGLCGSSDVIAHVYDIRYGFLQALYALSRCLSPIIFPGEKASSFLTSFRESYLDFLLYGRADNKELAIYCRENGVVERISADDENEDTDNLEVLVTYLLKERNATKTAAALYMHRSSLLYRVNALSKKYHLDFDLYAQRQTFLLEYHFMLERKMMR